MLQNAACNVMGLYVLAKEHHTANELKGRKFSARPEINKNNFKFVIIYTILNQRKSKSKHLISGYILF